MMWCPCLLGDPCGESHQRDLRAAAATFTVAVTLVDVAVYLAEVAVGLGTPEGVSWLAPPVCVLAELGGVDTPAIVRRGQVWRLLTPIFLHAGPLHIIMNMYVGTRPPFRRYRKKQFKASDLI